VLKDFLGYHEIAFDARKKAPTDQSTFGQWRTGEWYELSAQTMRFSRYARELFL
jgi:hypothetical protein